MALKEASWTHGSAVQLQNSSWSAVRTGGFTIVRPSYETTSGWLHFAIPTPVIDNGTRVKAKTALAYFTTGPKASVEALHVHDGDRNIMARGGIKYSGSRQLVRETIPNNPEVAHGTNLSILVVFEGTGDDNYIQVIGAGIDFS